MSIWTTVHLSFMLLFFVAGMASKLALALRILSFHSVFCEIHNLTLIHIFCTYISTKNLILTTRWLDIWRNSSFFISTMIFHFLFNIMDSFSHNSYWNVHFCWIQKTNEKQKGYFYLNVYNKWNIKKYYNSHVHFTYTYTYYNYNSHVILPSIFSSSNISISLLTPSETMTGNCISAGYSKINKRQRRYSYLYTYSET